MSGQLLGTNRGHLKDQLAGNYHADTQRSQKFKVSISLASTAGALSASQSEMTERRSTFEAAVYLDANGLINKLQSNAADASERQQHASDPA